MVKRIALATAVTLSGLLAACASPTPPLTAYQRNVGPGSGAFGVPSTTDGSVGRPGDPLVPGVSAAGPITR
jgi:hypothetical protein